MHLARIAGSSSTRCRSYYSTIGAHRPVQILADASVETFRQHAFDPAVPYLLPRASFASLPAVKSWFIAGPKHPSVPALNIRYLSRFGPTLVPLEIVNDSRFARIEYSLSFFLQCVNASNSLYITERPGRYFSAYVPGARAVRRTKENNTFFSATTLTPPTARIYLAQASIADLPHALRADLPTPAPVLEAGNGDVYDASIWLGLAPTYTPLHRDPNPNLFVQLAGEKVIRLFSPQVGNAIFSSVQEKLQGTASATMRGEEMMQGAERSLLEDEVWGQDSAHREHCWEASLGSGDALFIPKGWWHSVKGVGEGMTGSVNWWFR